MKKYCSICKEEYEGWGNNPRPFQRDLCCDRCNNRVIIPLRAFEQNYIGEALLIKPNDTPLTMEYFRIKDFKDIQKLVGGYVTIYPNRIFDNLTFFCDEDGELKKLKPNDLAFELYHIKAVGNVLIVPSNLRKVWDNN